LSEIVFKVGFHHDPPEVKVRPEYVDSAWLERASQKAEYHRSASQ